MLGKIIGIDPGLTATGIVLARPRNKGIEVVRTGVMGAEGENWYEKCDNLSLRIKNWIIQNTSQLDMIWVMVEEPTNMLQSRAWSAALQNRLLSMMVHNVTLIGMEERTVRVSIIHPMTVKKLFTGKGNADKDDMIDAAKLIYQFKKKWNRKIQEATADAIAIAHCCWLYNRSGDEDMKGIINI